MFRFQNQMFHFLLASTKWLVWGGKYKSYPLPPLEAASTTNELDSFPSLCELSPIPLCEVCVICEKSKLGLSEILFVSA
jgi:hypothetical protein